MPRPSPPGRRGSGFLWFKSRDTRYEDGCREYDEAVRTRRAVEKAVARTKMRAVELAASHDMDTDMGKAVLRVARAVDDLRAILTGQKEQP